MKQFSRWAVLFAVPLLLALEVPAAAGKAPTPKPRTLGTPVVWGMAMDGPRVAYNCEDTVNVSSNKIFVWNVLTGRRTLMSGSGTSRAAVGSTPIWGLAIAGRRVAWIAASAGNSERDETLFTSSLPTPKERKLAQAVRWASDCPTGLCPAGAWIHGLVGSGSVLAVSRWKTGADGSAMAGGGLDLITAGGLRRIVAGPNGIVAAASDASRIAVLRPSGPFGDSFVYLNYKPSEVAIYSTSGKLLKRFKPVGIDLNGGAQMAEVALQGDELAVLTPQPRLELYNWRSGSLRHSFRVPRGARQLDVQGQVATYIGANGLSLHVLGLRSGKDAVYPSKVSPLGLIDVAIEAPGLAYGFNLGNGRGELDFLPMSRVLAAIAKGHVR